MKENNTARTTNSQINSEVSGLDSLFIEKEFVFFCVVSGLSSLELETARKLFDLTEYQTTETQEIVNEISSLNGRFKDSHFFTGDALSIFAACLFWSQKRSQFKLYCGHLNEQCPLRDTLSKWSKDIHRFSIDHSLQLQLELAGFQFDLQETYLQLGEYDIRQFISQFSAPMLTTPSLFRNSKLRKGS